MKRVVAALGGCLLGSVATLAGVAIYVTRPPVQIISQTQFSATAREGGLLEINYSLYRLTDCNSPSHLWLWRWIDDLHKKRYFVSFPLNFITLADVSPILQDFTVARELPRTVTAGEWFMRVKYLDYCRLLSGILGPTSRTTKDMPVTVLPRE